MNEIITAIARLEIESWQHIMRNIAFTGHGDMGDIHKDVVTEVGYQWIRTRNSKQVKTTYTPKEYFDALVDAGYALSGTEIAKMIDHQPVELLLPISGGRLNMRIAGSREFIIRTSPKVLVRHIQEFLGSIPEINQMVDETYFAIKKASDLIKIEYPFLQARLEDTLGAKKIKYNLDQTVLGAMLSVQILGDTWMTGPLSTTNVERVISLTPYFIKRPDCLAEEMPDFRIVNRAPRPF